MRAIDLDQMFNHHPPTPDRIIQHETVRAGAKRYAAELLLAVPAGVERDNAIDFLRSTVMWANAGIACEPANWYAHGDELDHPDCPRCVAEAQQHPDCGRCQAVLKESIEQDHE